MDSSSLSGLVIGGIIGVLVLIFICIVLFLVAAPSQYKPHSLDLVLEDEANAIEETTKDANGQFSKQKRRNETHLSDMSVQVVVLGDIGRSPRMQYHALSLAKHGVRVDLIGFAESETHPDVEAEPLITIVPLSPPPSTLQTSNKLLFILCGPLKVIWQAFNLFLLLSYKTKPAKWMLVQNPPSIPVLAIAQMTCLLRNTQLIIDWHNFGWSVLALKLGPSHPLVLVSKLYENIFSRKADAHFAVTNAMCTSLAKANGIKALALHDRPAIAFQPLSSTERDAFLRKLPQTAEHANDLKSGKWRLLVSSTSWTPDEDFSLLLDALVAYSTTASTEKSLPYILAIITGKGPQKAHYVREIQALSQANKLFRVTIQTAWLSTSDYASLLGAADLGVSLHKSTSGVDLPMKIVDMFGAGLPVVGYSAYESWSELVKDGANGKGFTTGEELMSLLVELFGADAEGLRRIREGAALEGLRRWDDEWDEVAGKEVFRV